MLLAMTQDCSTFLVECRRPPLPRQDFKTDEIELSMYFYCAGVGRSDDVTSALEDELPFLLGTLKPLRRTEVSAPSSGVCTILACRESNLDLPGAPGVNL